MIQDALQFSTKFNVVPTDPTFVFTDTTDYAAEGIALTDVKGVFKIEGPTGIIYENNSFASPDITANVSLGFSTVLIPLDTLDEILKGNYTITYSVQIAGATQPGTYSEVATVYYCYEAPEGDVEVTNNVRLAKVTSTDLTSYPISGINPTLVRTHTLWYPSSLSLSPTTSGLYQIILSYPNVYTGTYAGKISTVATYVFTDGLIVDYLITAVDETIVDNKTLCDIYCGVKNLTNEMLAAKATGDFGKATKIQETLSLVSILYMLYDDAVTCGKESDATYWLNQIIQLANITVGCGCSGDEPSQVIPEGGGGSSGDVDVLGDASFGTEVTSVTVGSTTTYTVRLTQTYKDLILSALQSQDLSVAAFRAAGIPEEARGVTVTSIGAGGVTISLTPGTSKKVLVLTGSSTLSAAVLVQTVGTPIDGDSFIVDYRATATANGQTVTIFGLSLSPSEIASGNCLIYTWYAASNTTWYSKLISNEAGSAVQEGIAFWVNGADYILNKTVLYGTNPSLIYKNILAAGSGVNAPSGTTASNTYWEYVGNKSALYDASNNTIFDVTSGQPFILSTLATDATPTDVLVLDGQQIKKADATTFPLVGRPLATNSFLIGVGSLAAEASFNSTTLRQYNIAGTPGFLFYKVALPTSGSTNIDPSIVTSTYVIEGTVTLIGNVSFVPNIPTSKVGDSLWIDYKAAATLGGNTLTIIGVAISAADALVGNFGIYAYYDSALAIWVGRKISYGVSIPAGTTNQTVRYNASNVLEADPNVTQDTVGNLIALNSLRAGTGHAGAGTANVIVGVSNTVAGNQNSVSGSSNGVAGSSNSVSGVNNIVPGNNNSVVGNQNNVTGSSSNISGDNNIVSDSNVVVSGNNNNATGAAMVIGSNNAGSSNGGSVIIGIYNQLVSGVTGGFIFGLYGKLVNIYSRVFSNSNATTTHQEETAIAFGVTTNNSVTAIGLDGATAGFQMQLETMAKIEATFVGIQSAGSAGSVGDSATLVYKGGFKNIGGTIVAVGTGAVSEVFADAAAAAWTVNVQISASILVFVATGETNKTIQWTVHIKSINSGY